MKSSRKGQLGIIEMIMVMVVIVVLIIGGIYFYYTFLGRSLGKTGERMDLQSSKVLLASITSMPELQCSKRTLDINCIDTLKLMAAKDLMNEDRAYYVDKFGFKSIEIKKVYPEGEEEECNFNKFNENYPGNCNKWSFYDNKPRNIKSQMIISVPVSLYYPSKNIYEIGIIKIVVYK